MKIVKTVIICMFMLGLVASGAYAEKTDFKMGYVDLSRLFDEYSKTKDYDKTLENKHKEFEVERNVKIEKIRESQGKLGLLTDDKKKEEEKNIEALKASLQEYDKQKQTDLTKERNDKIREILLEIEKIVSDFAKEEGYSVILNDRVLIYGQEKFDLTETILKVLNAE